MSVRRNFFQVMVFKAISSIFENESKLSMSVPLGLSKTWYILDYEFQTILNTIVVLF
ncbi:MAG: hypothetical protein FWH29_04340 [Methanobrevibacter sp.]|nr:hypothetical protein [Methanobrevibacter sp.]